MTTAFDCARCSERLRDYLENRLDGADRTEVEAHLDACAGCRAELGALAVLVETEPEALTANERARLHNGVRAALGAPDKVVALTPRPRPRFAGLLGAAALIMVLLAGVIYLGGSSEFGGGDDSGASLQEADQGGGDGDGGREAAPAQGGGAGAGGGDQRAEDEAETFSDEEAATQPDPTFDPTPGPMTRSTLKQLGADLAPFTTYRLAYSAQKADRDPGSFLEALAEQAPDSVRSQVLACGQTILNRGSGSLLAAYGKTGTIDDQDVLVVGFAKESDAGVLDQFLILAWRLGSCEVVEDVSGQIRGP